ncbi:hypothetical protein BH23PSE1_BH23PSE1_00330 [soil metagenome]
MTTTKPSDPGPDDGLTDLARQIDAASRAADLQDFDAGASRIDRAVNTAAELAGVAVLITIVSIVFLNAAGRYGLGATMIWGDELVLSLLPWLGMLGMFLAIRRRQIIRIDFFTTLMSPAMRRVLEIVSSVFAAAAFLYLAFVSFQYVQLFGGDRTIYLRLQKGWFMAAMVIGPALAVGAYLILAYEDLRGRRRGSAP